MSLTEEYFLTIILTNQLTNRTITRVATATKNSFPKKTLHYNSTKNFDCQLSYDDTPPVHVGPLQATNHSKLTGHWTRAKLPETGHYMGRDIFACPWMKERFKG